MALGLPEVVGAVLRRVRKEDLGAALLVCRSWRREGEKPSLWAWVRLKANSNNMEQVALALGLPRLAKVTVLKVAGAVTDQLAQAILVHPTLREVSMAGASLARVDPD